MTESDDNLPSLDTLKQKIDQTEERIGRPSETSKGPSKTGLAMRMGVDLVCACAIGIALGIALDRWLNSSPLFFLTFMCAGAVAGFRLMMQTNAMAQKQHQHAETRSD